MKEPWKTRQENPEVCMDTLYNCVQIIANLSVLFFPFLPFSSEKIFIWLNLKSIWQVQSVSQGYVLPEISVLFERLDKKIVDEELDKLTFQSKFDLIGGRLSCC